MRRWGTRKVRTRLAGLAAELLHELRWPVKHCYTVEQLEFLREGYRSLPVRALAWAFNKRFGLNKTKGQIKSTLKNHGITSSRTGYFEKGHKPWNAETKGQGLTSANITSFRRGHMPSNKRRLWAERVSKDGYIEISIPERNPHTGHPTRFRLKHLWLWEYHNGPVPKGMALTFADGDRTNVVIGNLVLITRAELLRLNQLGYGHVPAELKPSLRVLAKVEVKAFERRRKA